MARTGFENSMAIGQSAIEWIFYRKWPFRTFSFFAGAICVTDFSLSLFDSFVLIWSNWRLAKYSSVICNVHLVKWKIPFCHLHLLPSSFQLPTPKYRRPQKRKKKALSRTAHHQHMVCISIQIGIICRDLSLLALQSRRTVLLASHYQNVIFRCGEKVMR